jgi:hypothetical protein
MTDMTHVDGHPDRRQAKRGMAFFAGTGPDDKTCADCIFRGYRRKPKHSKHAHGGKPYWYGGCRKYREMASKHGAIVARFYPACKYFEQKPECKGQNGG